MHQVRQGDGQVIYRQNVEDIVDCEEWGKLTQDISGMFNWTDYVRFTVTTDPADDPDADPEQS